MDQDEAGTNSIVPDTAPASREDTEPPTIKGEESKPATPKPHPLSISFQPPTPPPVLDDGLDASLQPTEGVLDGVVGDIGGDIALDLTEIGPDGEPFEGADELSQLQAADALLGGPLIDETMDDPFVVPE